MTEKNIDNKGIWKISDKELMTLIIGRDGGKTAIRIIDEILKRPYNKNQLSNILNLDYNTITYHINIIYKHEYITKEKFGESYFFHPSDKLFKSLEEYKLIKEYLNNKK